ncbi:SpoIIIAH-like family protein [Cohnella abietis]|uniref:Stage III sporulation protein AH n=1 Tax=Cohnella abietis TaxID=2507935 RepID=A0A3T1D523_9BACL|nr:SpoIIIAH-like family protein [Cohnella abietis]BBI33075.1 hypothetical protein KCTCHS21_24740 [Cohnella abietis]
MNNKRQTIWLVSMLSLMVILSAYYLFTEEAPKTDNASGIEQTKFPDAGKVSSSNPDGFEITEVEQSTDDLSATGQGTKSGAKTDEAKGTAAVTNNETAGNSPEDEAVLNGITNQKGFAEIDKVSLDQLTRISKKAEEYRLVIANKKSSAEEAASAVEALDLLQDTDSRITSLQEKLLQEFDNAVVAEEDNNNFKVIVLSEKLEKKQAVGIIEMATKELNVTPDRVTVQYVK